jgi:hypothetical protein
MLFTQLVMTQHLTGKTVTITPDAASGQVLVDIDHKNGVTSHSIENIYGAAEFIKRELNGDAAMASRVYSRIEPFVRSF